MNTIMKIAILVTGIAMIYFTLGAGSLNNDAKRSIALYPPGIITYVQATDCSSDGYTVQLYQNNQPVTGLLCSNSNCLCSIDLFGISSNIYDVYAYNQYCSGWHKNVKWPGGSSQVLDTVVIDMNTCKNLPHH